MVGYFFNTSNCVVATKVSVIIGSNFIRKPQKRQITSVM